MAEPTLEELQKQIDDLKEIVTTEYLPPSGPEYSFPVPDQPMNQDQFQLLSLSNGNGIFDRGDYPYWLEGHGSDSETNSKDSMILKVGGLGKAEAIVAGFFHMMTEDKEIPLPAVTSETTYRICLTYDPRRDLESLGPVTIEVYTTPPPTTFGRISVVLYEVTRKPNQLLTNAKIERYRPRAVPSITVLREEHLPNPESVLFGSLGFLYGDKKIMVARGASAQEGGPDRWDDLFAPSVSVRGDSPGYEWAGSGNQFRSTRVGNLVVLEGRLKRTSGAAFKASYSDGYHIRTLPETHRPSGSKRYITKADGFNNLRDVVINVGQDGLVYAYPRQDCSWVSVDGIVYTVE